MKVKLNLGGGSSKLDGFINIDILALPGVDIVADLNRGIPLKDNCVQEVVAFHILEHLSDTVHIMEELYRVCAPQAVIRIKVPYYTSIGSFKDPTHIRFFTEKTFEYFSNQNHNLPKYMIKAKFDVKKINYIWFNPIFGLPIWRNFLRRYLWNIARTMYVELGVLKEES